MKLLSQAAQMVREVFKRDGVFVSRPVLNAAEWAAWATKWNVPNPVPADQMHSTSIYSPSVDVKMKGDDTPIVIAVNQGCFALFGKENEVLVFAFDSWRMHERHWDWQRMGAVSTWPTYRPHLTLTYQVGAFELSDEAVADAPNYIVLGGEVSKAPKPPTVDEIDPEGLEDGIDAEIIIVIDLIALSAAKVLEENDSLTTLDRAALYELSHQKRVTKGVAKRLAAEPWATDEIKQLTAAPVEKAAPKTVEKEITLTIRPIERADGSTKEIFKNDDERQLIWGIGAVSTVAGELVKHVDGDKMTTRALEDWTIDLIRGQRESKFEHAGDACNTVVQALVLSEELQKSLGFDLGREILVACTHVPDPTRWAEVKEGDWEFSIAGLMLVVEDEA